MSKLTIDELFADAQRAQQRERARPQRAKAAPPPDDAEEAKRSLFSNPKNWLAGRGVALIHRETRTLLGNFQEYRHTTVADARRLVRSLLPISIDAVEEVDFGLEGLAPELPQSVRAETVRRWTGPVVLDTPAVRAPSVELDVAFYSGWTIAARLISDTVFAEDGELLMLPAGTNLFPALSRETKIALRSVA